MQQPVDKTTAILLKECGYGEPCTSYYKDGLAVRYDNEPLGNHNVFNFVYSAPLLFDAILWMDSKGYHVECFFEFDKTWYVRVIRDNGEYAFENAITGFPSRESAYAEGLKVALTHYKNQIK